MTDAGQLLLIALAAGLVVGGVAALASKGEGLIAYIVAGVIGSAAFFYGSGLVVSSMRDPSVVAIITSAIGAIIFVGLARALFVK